VQPIRILVVDDCLLIRRGIAAILSGAPEMVIVGTAGSAEEALHLAAESPADVALVEVRLPGMSGVDLCRRLRQAAPDLAVLMLTACLNEDLVRESLQAGARGYLLKDVDDLDLIRSVRSVARGEAAIAPKAAALLVNLVAAGQDSPGITADEMELLRCISRGMTNREMAGQLYISENTVKDRVLELFRKLHVKGRVEAVMEGVRRGLL
jgi:DNA-binding NarL/FixJ family response regulator